MIERNGLQALIARLDNFRANEVHMGRMTGYQDDTLRLVIDDIIAVLAQQQLEPSRDIDRLCDALADAELPMCSEHIDADFVCPECFKAELAAAVLQPPQEQIAKKAKENAVRPPPGNEVG